MTASTLLGLGGLALLALVLFLALVGIALYWLLNRFRRSAGRDFASLGDYLRAIPVSDVEKRNAVDLASLGGVVCLLGLLVPPVVIIGVFPLFFGGRKVICASLGLGLLDDSDAFGE